MIQIQNFINKYKGQFVTNADGSYKDECVSLCHRWQDENGWPEIHANAIDWQKFGGWNGYQFIVNHVWTIPKTGDVAVFNCGKYGHVGIVVSANIKSMVVFNQNYPHGTNIDPATLTTFNYTAPKCIGFIRRV